MLTQWFATRSPKPSGSSPARAHIRGGADLAEGYEYLAGHIRGSLQIAWAYQRDFPYFAASTGPYTKMGLDNPDTLYFHSLLARRRGVRRHRPPR